MNSATDFARVRVLPLILALAATSVVGCTRPGKTTAIGSGVGGAVGAGVGAIVGSQSGNAGVGVAIGAAAGAATGALIGNAFQAQEERNLAQDEIIKRQERSLQAQKNEIAELRTIRGDIGAAYNPSFESQVRYRYRPTSVSADSPEVARQRARLQQRGPLPAGSSAGQRAAVYSAPFSAPRYQPQPSRVEPAKRAPSTGTLARYDVRSELSPTGTPVRVKEVSPAQPPAATTSAKGRTPAILPVADADNSAQSVMESDLPIAKAEAAVVSTSAQPATKECKEALTERDRAAEATENSDKLYHLRRALRLCPNSAPLHHELGKVYASMDRRSDAENEFKAALGIDPNLAASKKSLGDLLKEEVQF